MKTLLVSKQKQGDTNNFYSSNTTAMPSSAQGNKKQKINTPSQTMNRAAKCRTPKEIFVAIKSRIDSRKARKLRASIIDFFWDIKDEFYNCVEIQNDQITDMAMDRQAGTRTTIQLCEGAEFFGEDVQRQLQLIEETNEQNDEIEADDDVNSDNDVNSDYDDNSNDDDDTNDELNDQEKPYFREDMYEFGDIEECFVLIEQDHIEHDTPSVRDYEENPNLFHDHILALTLEAHREDMCKSSYRRMRLWEKITKMKRRQLEVWLHQHRWLEITELIEEYENEGEK